MDQGAAMGTPARLSALAPFSVRSFRFQWPADLATSWAFEMETLILGWYVLVETESVLMLTLFGSLQFVGTLIAPMFGVGGDRLGHRNLLCAMRATYALLALTLMILAFTDILSPVHVFAVAAVAGLVRPSDLVMRNALVGETMPPGVLMGAMSISRTTADSARAAGALAGAGLVAVAGMGPAYAVIASLYTISFLLTLAIGNRKEAADPAAPASAPPISSPWRDLKEGAVYIWATPRLRAAMYLAFLVNLTAFPLTGGLLPYVAREEYGLDRTGLGYLVAGFASGALLGSLALSRFGAGIRAARMTIVFAIVWYAFLLVFIQMPGPVGGFAMLVVAGFVQSLCMVPMSVMLLRGSGARLRGRVMGVRMLAVYGLPLGLLAAGPLIEMSSYAATATAYAGGGLLFTLVIAIRWRAELWPADAPGNAR